MSNYNTLHGNSVFSHAPTVDAPIAWNGGLVAISYLVSVLASYAALRILHMRFSVAMVLLSAACLSLSGIWSMHFVGMAAYEIPAAVQFDVAWTILSGIFAFVSMAVAFVFLHFKLNQMERDEDACLKQENTVEGNILAFLTAPHLHIFSAAVLVALGVCAMHYTGMHAMSAKGAHVKMNWGVIVASILIALFAATAALNFALIFPLTKHFSLVTALVMGVAVCGMHYTGMYGFTFTQPAGEFIPSESSSRVYVTYIVFFSCALSAAAIAISSHIYRLRLLSAVRRAEEMAAKISRADFKTDDANSDDEDTAVGFPEMKNLLSSYEKTQKELTRLRGFLPDSIVNGIDDSDDDDEGSINLGTPHSPVSNSTGSPTLP